MIKLFNARNYLLGLITLLIFAISYYFIIALPSHNKDKLLFEREKFGVIQKEKSQKEDESKFKESMLSACIDDAEEEYWSYVKLNGGKEVQGEPGVYTASHRVWEEASKIKKAALERCYKLYK